MVAQTAAQEEFDSLVAKATVADRLAHHPSDLDDYKHDNDHSDRDEEDQFHQHQIDKAMKFSAPNYDVGSFKLPHKDFDSGRTTGVKGVIADARSFEEARRNERWRNKHPVNITSFDDIRGASGDLPKYEDEASESEDEAFMERWRQSRRDELVRDGNDIRNRRSSPSVRVYGRFDEVNAMGYLDAIEKVRRDTVVVVFVYDPESSVSEVIQDALEPLVPSNPSVHFVRIHYEDIEFDPAAVPAVLAYKNQGDLFANLTYIIGQIPEDTVFDTAALESIFIRHKIL